MGVLYSGDGVAVVEIGPLCVAIWRGSVTQASFARQKDGLAHVVKAHPDGAAFMCVIEPTSSPPDDELRRASTRMLAEHGELLRCVAIVIEGDGFRAAIARSVIVGMSLFYPRRQPASTFPNVGAGLTWVHQHVPIATRVGAIAEIEKARELLGLKS